MVSSVHRILEKAPNIDPYNALQLLGSSYADTKVREFAVRCLWSLSDGDLVDLLLQLVRSLRCEPYFVSELALFLLHRAWLSPNLVGHSLFWFLRSEHQNPQVATLYWTLLEAMRVTCPNFDTLMAQTK